MLFKNDNAYSMTFWAIFIGTVSVPIIVLAIEISRFYYARAEVAKAADAAALASAIEINYRIFQESGELVPTPNTWIWAQQAASANTMYLGKKGIEAVVSEILVDDSSNTVKISVSANVSALFPSFLPKITITQWAIAEVRAMRE